MASVETSIIVGRFVFFALMVTQCFFLASYPAYYEDEGAWYAASLLFFPAVTMWWYLISTDAKLNEFDIFWMLYIWLGIVPMIGIVFGRIGNKVGNNGFWNATTLKMTLCITPLLHILIRHTEKAASDRDVRVTQLSQWSAKAMMNLFDGIELVAVILDENEHSHGISRHFMNTLIAFTCISFLWWPIDMLIYQEDDDDSVAHVVNDFVQVSFDTIYLGLRLGLWLGYGKNTSIFMNKNIVIIIIYSRRIFNFFFVLQDSNNGSTANQQQGESRLSSASATAPVVLVNTTRGGHSRASRSSIAPLPTVPATSYEDSQLPPYDVSSPPPYNAAPPPPYSIAPLSP